MTTTLCTIPAMGVRPPFFTLLDARATAPATGAAPKMPQKILAMPSAMSSWLELCFSPISPSVTEQASRETMAIKIASVTDRGNRSTSVSGEITWISGYGKWVGRSPYTE